MQQQLDFYRENGYVGVPQALSAYQVEIINQVIDRDLVDNRPLWIEREEGRTILNVHALLCHAEMDITIRPPTLLPLLYEILGDQLCAEEHSVRIRHPNPDGEPYCHWHRDTGGSPGAKAPYFTRYISVAFYLSDCDDTTHTFSVIPGSANSSERPGLETYDLQRAHHITGAEGTAVLFNAELFHAGNVRRTSVERRTIHIYCGRIADRYLSDYTLFPRRLWQGKGADVQKYYSRPNPVTQAVLDHF